MIDFSLDPVFRGRGRARRKLEGHELNERPIKCFEDAGGLFLPFHEDPAEILSSISSLYFLLLLLNRIHSM